MVKRVSCLLCLCAVLATSGIALGAPLAPDDGSLRANLCLWLRMPEVYYDPGAKVWTDLSGKGHDARASVAGYVGPTVASGANPTVFAHPFSSLHFAPTVQELLKTPGLNGGAGLTQLTIFSVEKVVTAANVDQRAVGFGAYQDGGAGSNRFNLSFDVTVRKDNGNIPGKNQDHPLNAFVIYAARMDPAKINMWFNSTGTLSLAYTATGSSFTTSTDLFYVGDLRYAAGSDFDVAEVIVFNTALTDAQVAGVSEWLQTYVGTKGGTKASNGEPANGATDVPQDVILTWTPVTSAVQRDVYLGTVFTDVNSADRAHPMNVLVSPGQTATTFVPANRLAYGQTYYWRIDEVNKAPDSTVFKGDVWSFTVEPYAYPIKPAAATASSAQPGMGPEKTIDGSGLDKTGLHGTDPTTMWMSAGAAPNWIQYQFDQAYKLYDLSVWNANQIIETTVGLGAKKVTLETSLDGTAWTPVANVPEFAKAPGTAGYAANTTVPLSGVSAKYVKLTINSTWGGAPVTGLSEVRFSQIPTAARGPQPATGATGISLDTNLDWRPGREAASHKVFFGTDPCGVAKGTVAAKMMANHGYVPGALSFGTAYYWRVDEVNTATYPGDVWSFTTQEYAVVDNFESYTDKPGAEIFTAWVDGFVDKSSGSVVGYVDAANGTFGETTIVHSGRQSMPFEYNNVKAPFYSEAERTFDTLQNWTGNGADTLSLYFRGYPVAFADQGNNAYTVSGGGADIGGNSDQFRFVYKQLSGDGSITARVDSQANTNTATRAGVMIRETLDAGSRHATIAVTPGSSITFQSRATNNSATTTATVAGGLKAPYWVRITRTGNTFKAECSPDGKTWTQAGTDQTIVMGSSVYLGLAVTSHVAAQIGTAEFSNVSTTGTVTGQWQALAIGAAQRSNSPEPLYLVVEDKAGKKKTVVNANPAATTAAAWTEWRIPFSDLSAGGVNLAAVKKIALGVGDRASPKAGTAGLLYFDDIGYGHPVK